MVSRHFLACLLVLGLMGMLFLPNLLFVGFKSDSGRLGYLEAIVYSLCFWGFWFALFKRISIGLLLAVIPSVWWFPSAYLRWEYLSPINTTFYGMYAETNWQELYGFASALGVEFLWGLLLPMAALIIGSWVAHRAQLSWTHRSRYGVLFLFPTLALLMMWFFNQNTTPQAPIAPSAKEASVFQTPSALDWWDKWSTIYPTELYFAIREYRHEQAAIETMRETIDRQPSGVLSQNAQRAAEVIVLVIGESANARRWSLYGFERETTPLLKARQDLIVLKDVVSPSIATRNSVPVFIARRPLIDENNRVDPLAQPSMLRILSRLGYETHWISNQASSGEHDTPIVFYAKEAQYRRYLNPAQYFHQGSHDEVILPVLQSVLAKPGRKFIVLHTMGSHFNYAHRYPKAFEVFQPAVISNFTEADRAEKNKAAVSNAYDNSTRYTDHFLNEVLLQLQATGQSSALLYSADHGEDVDEPGCKPSPFQRLSQASFQVPAFVWASPQAITKNKEAIERLSKRADTPMTTRVYVDVLADLAGLSLAPMQASQVNWLSESWMPGVRWVGRDYARQIDFDTAKQANPCVIFGAKQPLDNPSITR